MGGIELAGESPISTLLPKQGQLTPQAAWRVAQVKELQANQLGCFVSLGKDQRERIMFQFHRYFLTLEPNFPFNDPYNLPHYPQGK
jgi:hypothetical protein